MITTYNVTLEPFEELPIEWLDEYESVYYVISQELLKFLKKNRHILNNINVRTIISPLGKLLEPLLYGRNIIKYAITNKLGIYILESLDFKYNTLNEINRYILTTIIAKKIAIDYFNNYNIPSEFKIPLPIPKNETLQSMHDTVMNIISGGNNRGIVL